jgi:GNAT superfamily N-acetyltransferase
MASVIDLLVPESPPHLDAVRDLFRAFVGWHRERHSDDLHLIERYFDAAEFEAELAGLPGKYAAPDGSLLLAEWDGEAAGCVAMRRIDADACEMKRMFVYPEQRGRRIGIALAEAIIADARALGYRRMLLDTSIHQVEAQALYRRFGFTTIPPYYDLPEPLRDWLVFMELEL